MRTMTDEVRETIRESLEAVQSDRLDTKDPENPDPWYSDERIAAALTAIQEVEAL